MAKGQQRSNKEKKKPKQDKKKLPPAPSPLSLDQRAKPGQGGGQKKPDRALSPSPRSRYSGEAYRFAYLSALLPVATGASAA